MRKAKYSDIIRELISMGYITDVLFYRQCQYLSELYAWDFKNADNYFKDIQLVSINKDCGLLLIVYDFYAISPCVEEYDFDMMFVNKSNKVLIANKLYLVKEEVKFIKDEAYSLKNFLSIIE